MPISNQEVSKYHAKITKTVTSIKKDYNIQNQVAKRFLVVKNPKPAKITLYIKDHKPKKDNNSFKTRIVVSTRQTPSNNILSWFEKVVHKYLTLVPMADTNTSEAISKISSWTTRIVQGTHKLVKMDIKELFPSVPPDLAINRLLALLRKNNILGELLADLKINEQRLASDLTICVTGGILDCNGDFYTQLRGLPIGSTVSPLLANFYLAPIISLIETELSLCDSDYCRYVDDFLFLIPVDIDPAALLDLFNSFDPNITFTLESSATPMSYLQLLLEYDRLNLKISWFRKKEAGNTFLHYSSNVPYNSKRSNVFNHLKLFDLINEANAPQVDSFDHNWEKLRNILLDNNYPLRIINQWKEEYKEKVSELASKHKTNNQQTKLLTFQELLNELGSSIVDVPADGHCLLHAICGATGLRFDKVKSQCLDRKSVV